MEKKSKKSVVIGITILLLVTLILLGLTYAYYRTRIVGNEEEKSISVTSEKLEVTYSDDKAVIEAEGIEPGYTATKTFTVTNTGSETASYSIRFDNLTNTFVRKDWTYKLYSGTEVLEDNLLISGTLITEVRNSSQIILPQTTIESGEDVYTLVLTYEKLDDIDQSEDMGAGLSLRVNIGENTMTWETASEGTLLYAIKSGNEVSETLTNPGDAPYYVSDTDKEALLSSTEDDYGTSYYYRGLVDNNYVNFSGMCWRIVRIQGDGTIKLVLADYENGCKTEEGYTTSKTTSALPDEVAYKAELTYTHEDFIYENSDIPAVLEAWKNNEDKPLDTTKMAITDWCNDVAQAKKRYYDSDLLAVDDPAIAAATHIDYAAKIRVEETGPILKCNSVGMDGSTEALKYKGDIAILSVDEILFAGGKNRYSYISTNLARKGYWTMTPAEWSDYWRASNDKTFGTGSITDILVQMYSFSTGVGTGHKANHDSGVLVRPAVTLRSDVTIVNGGNGTQDNPYVII